MSLEVEINNLGSKDTLKRFNQALVARLKPRISELSDISQTRLDTGQALRILDSKSPQDQEVLASVELPDIDEFIEYEW